MFLSSYADTMKKKKKGSFWRNSNMPFDIKTKILFRSVYVVMMFFALLSGAGVFGNLPVQDGSFWDYYTNQSNILCLLTLAAGLFLSVRSLYHPLSEKVETVFTTVEYLVAIWILITCLVYNLMLAPTIADLKYFGSYDNPMLHLFGPILFITDFLLFGKRKCLKAWEPFLALIYPYLYVAFAWIRGAIVKANPSLSKMIYPYFFLDADQIGWGMAVGWVMILSVIFIGFGYLFYVLNNLPLKRKND